MVQEEYEISRRASFGGILIDSDSIDAGTKKFTTMFTNTLYNNPTIIYDEAGDEKKGYCTNMTLTGLDDAAFASFLKKAGVTGEEEIKKGEFKL